MTQRNNNNEDNFGFILAMLFLLLCVYVGYTGIWQPILHSIHIEQQYEELQLRREQSKYADSTFYSN